jgi:hypothetical protein
MAASHDQHSGYKQLGADMTGRVGMPGPRCDTGRLGEDVVSATRHFAQLSNRLGEVVLRRSVTLCGAVQFAVQQLVFRGHTRA